MIRLAACALATAMLLCPRAALAADLLVAAASSLSFAVEEMIEQFERATSHRVRLTLGSSGNFYNQITNGAPFDVFLSADADYPARLAAAGWVEDGSPFVYAEGRLALWVRSDSPLDIEAEGMAALVSTRGRIAIANPRHAPYGRAAIAAMEHYGFAGDLARRLALGENASQAAQFAQSGAAAAGIVPLSLALSPPMRNAGRWVELAAESYPRIEHAGAVLTGARRAGKLEAARAFVDWVRGPRGRRVLADHGLAPPTPPIR